MKEVWRDIQKYNGKYQVSNIGRVRSIDCMVRSSHGEGSLQLKKGKVKTLFLSQNGYHRLTLSINGKHHTESVHRLVALAFIPLINGKNIINHKNSIRTDNRVENLEWCTYSENVIHAINSYRLGKTSRWKPVIDLSNGVFYESIAEAARYNNIKHKTLFALLSGANRNKTSLRYA